MNKEQFTPGPWVIGKINSHTIFTELDGGESICEVEHLDNYKANANLIAAAPDMYEALKNFVKHYSNFIHPDDMTMIEAKAALNKANPQL
jgi:hypothetical protein